MEVLWAPFPGKQTTFLRATEFDVLFGGAKGPGKTDCILMGSLRQVGHEKYKALILRATFPELQELIDRSHALFPRLPERPRWHGESKRWIFPNPNTHTGAMGGVVQFGYCDKVEDVENYHGKEFAYIGYDEIGNLKEERVIDRLQAEIRCPNPDVVWMFRASANPGGVGHSMVKRRYIRVCGEQGEKVLMRRVTIPNIGTRTVARRFIPARVQDNPVYANNPAYMGFLLTLPEVLKKQLLEGDWSAGLGTALDELEWRVHGVDAFPIPRHWQRFGSFDWGFAHNWAYIDWAVDEDGNLYVVNTVKGRRQRVDHIALTINDSDASDEGKALVFAGHDCFSERKARSGMENPEPSIMEEMQEYGITLVPANTSRRGRLYAARMFTGWKKKLEGGTRDGLPAVRFLDTPGNRWLFGQLEDMVTDPDDPNIVLKVDSDPVTGEGGDDGYDTFGFGVTSRPLPTPSLFFDQKPLSAFDPRVLQHEYETLRRDRDHIETSPIIGSGAW